MNIEPIHVNERPLAVLVGLRDIQGRLYPPNRGSRALSLHVMYPDGCSYLGSPSPGGKPEAVLLDSSSPLMSCVLGVN